MTNVLIILASFMVTPDRADVLDAIPDSAVAAVVLRDWPDTQSRVAALGDTVLAPWVPSVEMMKRRMWIAEGLQESGDAALVMFRLESQGDPADGLVLFLPVENEDRILALWQPQEVRGGVRPIVWQNQPAFAGFHREFVVISPSAANVQRVLRSSRSLVDRLGDNMLNRMARADANLWLDMERLGPRGRDLFFLTWLSAAGESVRNAAQAAESILLGAKVTPKGIRVDGYVEQNLLNEAFWPTIRDDIGFSLLDGDSCVSLGWVGGQSVAPFLATSLSGQASTIVPAKLPDFEQTLMRLAGGVELGTLEIVSRMDGDQPAYMMGCVLRTEQDPNRLAENWRALLRFIQRGPFLDPVQNALATSLKLLRDHETVEGVAVDHIIADVRNTTSADAQKLERLLVGEGLRIRVARMQQKLIVVVGGETEDLARIIQKLREKEAYGSTPAAAGTRAARRSFDAQIVPARFSRFLTRFLADAAQTGDSLPAEPTVGQDAQNTAIHVKARPHFNGLSFSVDIPVGTLQVPKTQKPDKE
ncbi:MAG: hypothetical protein ACPGXK_03070 [Phycisphaerae bacterium]